MIDYAVSESFWHRVHPYAMKYAIISDIHVNPTAFKAVLADARRQKVDRIVCLGDVMGYGYDVVESYMLAKESCDVWLLGNHDAACAGVDADALIRGNPHYDLDIAERRELGRDRLAEIRDLPYTFANRHFACAHGDFHAPEDFDYIMCADDARSSFCACDRNLMFVGHTHEAKVWILTENNEIETSGIGKIELKTGCRYVVDVGSVGYPRRNLFSSYALYDSCAGTVDLRRIEFDLIGYIKAFRDKGLDLPNWLERLSKMSESVLRNVTRQKKLRL